MNDCIRKLANGHWNTRYVGPDGRRYSRTFRVKQDATYWRSHELRLIDIDRPVDPAAIPEREARTHQRPHRRGVDREVHPSQGEPFPPTDQADDRRHLPQAGTPHGHFLAAGCDAVEGRHPGRCVRLAGSPAFEDAHPERQGLRVVGLGLR